MASALSPSDPSSFSRPDLCLVKALHIDLRVDFEKHILLGKVTLKVERKLTHVDSLILDTRELKIHKVTNTTTGEKLTYTLDDPLLSFGSKLEINLGKTNETNLTVCVEYETSSSSTALQWLEPEQTAGKRQPYLFSQCQAIHARSMLPCQDSPGVKMPYTATVTASSQLTALMSAVKTASQTLPGDASSTAHNFEQKVPVPSYLIAIVVGALESRKIGPRSKVWCEKEMVDAAAYEFAETEKMLATAEGLCGPYVWGIYDLLVLPPSFPYGGMENPCLTFVTPTLLAGDRSLAAVVAHEITHSWTGNLVTNKSPEDFWLNEGHTVFVERKIAGRMVNEQLRHFEALGGWTDLQEQVRVFGEDHPFTELVPNLTGVDPDDAFSTVPYEKGSSLLMYLEEKLGGPAVFEPFIRAYIDNFKYQSITTTDWKEFLFSFFKDKVELLNEVDWQAWFHGRGMPPVKPTFDMTLANECAALQQHWVSSTEDLSKFNQDDLINMSPFQVKEFLSQLLSQLPLPTKKIEKMQAVYKFNEVRNSEIRFRWLRLCLKARQEEAIARALEFVNEQGRMKFVRPIYRDLIAWELSREQAVDNYKQQASSMHSLTAAMVGKDLKLVNS
ncbi:Leukotriene A-4 hydrolase [Lamellibrachia satsuma]|nr:Leukotriene A-4 hydrolase [Lamellibrachia satsuma]